jgi:hypothetical protein
MSDIKYWRRQAEIWENNAHFYLQEVERANALYNVLLHQFEELKRELNECRNQVTKDCEPSD